MKLFIEQSKTRCKYHRVKKLTRSSFNRTVIWKIAVIELRYPRKLCFKKSIKTKKENLQGIFEDRSGQNCNIKSQK